ncbi:MAG: alpha/beta hydrolase [Anaerolineae bacterium]|nr:alpha/beta hydrolase [Anaerolineae bacterium]
MTDIPLEKVHIACGDIRLHVVMAGPSDGPPVILLHGFPEFWYGWHHQIPALAAAGFRVIVPDQRGYHLSDKPPQRAAYTLDQLANDSLNLMAALGHAQVHLVGHDWGAAVAWELAEMHPQYLRSLTILNVPHTRIFEQAMQRGNWARDCARVAICCSSSSPLCQNAS